ncbi:MAG TPA: nitrate- and nitrite sensing domain-containing protein [Candidatus Limnocylindrales bacterium]
MRSRGWSIRAKIMTLAVVPLIAITGLAVFGVAATVGPALNLLETNKYDHAVTSFGELVVVELQKERRMSGGGSPTAPDLLAQRGQTDERYRLFKQRFADDNGRESLPAGHVATVDSFVSNMDGLAQVRADFDAGKADASTTVGLYNGIIDAAYVMFAPLTYVSDAHLSQVAHSIYGMSRARELLAREDSVVTAAISDQKITATERTRLLMAIGSRRHQQDEAMSRLTPQHRASYQAIVDGNAYTTLFAMEESLGNLTGEKVPIDPGVWRVSTDSVLNQLDRTEDAAAAEALALANKVGVAAFSRPLIAGLAGLLCAALALVLALRTGRSVVRRLERLRVSALAVANEQLPRAIAVLRQPGAAGAIAADPALNVPMVAVGTDEVGQVGHAFEAVQRTAIRAAVDEATLRRGISDVFLNIARRSQALLHRQLTLLDRMERRTTTPQELEDLFKLDHMATRMRRHAEALVILAGSAPGRGWRHPVPIVDVVRGATSEIEDYVRVSIERLPELHVAGRSVGDLIHLLAELLENATSFAPPHTQVRVHAEAVGNGLALQIEDRGLGMSEQELAEANLRLAEPPLFDPAHSARLGLLVVAKLAERQGVTVRLRTSPYGGVTAVILIPAELVVAGAGAEDTSKPLTSAVPHEISAQSFVQDKGEAVTVPIVDGLPRRVRRAIPEAPPKADPDTTATVVAEAVTVDLKRAQPAPEQIQRSADEVRSRMAAFQSGSLLGRAHAAKAASSQDITGGGNESDEGGTPSGTDDDATRDRLAP